jgi:hypothetical protein
MAKMLVSEKSGEKPAVHQLERVTSIGKLTCGMERTVERVCICLNPTGK